jgi:hypothetical protein
MPPSLPTAAQAVYLLLDRLHGGQESHRLPLLSKGYPVGIAWTALIQVTVVFTVVPRWRGKAQDSDQ